MFRIKLPTTSEQFDNLVAKIARKYEFTWDEITGVLIQTIRFAAKDQMYVSRSKFISSLEKIRANAVSDEKMKGLQLSYLTKAYKEDPSNPQVIQALQQLADQGNEVAKDLLAAPIVVEAGTK
jgi:hypothetical protein